MLNQEKINMYKLAIEKFLAVYGKQWYNNEKSLRDNMFKTLCRFLIDKDYSFGSVEDIPREAIFAIFQTIFEIERMES